MKRYILLLLTAALLFSAAPLTTARAMVVGNGSQTVSGKLVTMAKLKKSYKLIVGKKVLFIIDDGNQQNRELIKKARSLVDKQVTVIYLTAGNKVVTIFPAPAKEGK